MMGSMEDPDVTIRLTVSEFIVLDELLRRFSETGELAIEDQAEQRALWNIQCLFEKESNRLDSWPNLEKARESLRDSPGS